MTNKKWLLLILLIAGLILLLIPGEGKAVIVFNERHGPSLQDLAGLILIMTSWVLSSVVVIKNWKGVQLKTGQLNSGLMLVVYMIAIAGIVLSLVFSSDLFLWICVGVASLINILFIIYAFSKT